jgi:hypothetical protein
VEYGLNNCFEFGGEDENDEGTGLLSVDYQMIYHTVYVELAGEFIQDFSEDKGVYVIYDDTEYDHISRRADVYHCVTFSKALIPDSLNGGVAKRTFFELEYASVNDYENYILKLWDPVDLRTPQQAVDNLNADPLKLFEGKTLALPYSVPGTALFTTWIAPFAGVDRVPGLRYGAPSEGDPRFGPVIVRAGISAVIKLQEEGTQNLEQDDPIYYYMMSLDSLAPEIEYPFTDTSKYVTLAFIWNSDDTFYYQAVLQITNVGMAALLITTIASSIVAIADGTSIYLDWEERNQKS